MVDENYNTALQRIPSKNAFQSMYLSKIEQLAIRNINE